MPKYNVYLSKPHTVTETKVLDHKPTLAEMQEMIGGYIERVNLNNPGKVMYVDEDGLAKNLEVNSFATFLTGTTIVGNAVILDGFDLD